ncbi:MAG: serine hydrolase [Acidimicrobiales bacterium]
MRQISERLAVKALGRRARSAAASKAAACSAAVSSAAACSAAACSAAAMCVAVAVLGLWAAPLASAEPALAKSAPEARPAAPAPPTAGSVRAFGSAIDHGSPTAAQIDTPIVGIAATPDGGGYWLAAAAGGVFSFGDARPHGTPRAGLLGTPVVGIASTPDGGGYWLADAGGGVFAFGDARPHGSPTAAQIDTPIAGIAATPDGGGYWLAAAGGGVFSFGDARYEGSVGGQATEASGVGIARDGAGGYWVAYGPAGPAQLGPQISAYLSSRAGDATAALYDAATGKVFVYRPGVALPTASIVKVDIMEALLHQVAGSPGQLSAADQGLLHSMIEVSDNNAASALWSQVGGAGGVAAFDAKVGLTGTTPGCCGYWGLTATTATDQVALVRELAFPSALLNGAQQRYALNLMENVVPYEAWGVSGGVPPGVTVALKNGWLPLANGWAVNSIGWVDGGGRDYVLAVLSGGSVSEGYGIQTIEGVSQVIWKALDPGAPALWTF